MTTFYFIRHGNRDMLAGDPSLSPQGIAQARATAQWLRDKPIAAVFASPLRRAHETAEWIAHTRDLAVIADARLRERMNWGDAPNQSLEAFVALWDRCTRERDFAPPVGDSARGAGERVESFVRERSERLPHGDVVAVLHGGVLTDFLINVFGDDELRRWHPQFVAKQNQIVPECSITIVRYDGGQYVMESFADTQHLHELSF